MATSPRTLTWVPEAQDEDRGDLAADLDLGALADGEVGVGAQHLLEGVDVGGEQDGAALAGRRQPAHLRQQRPVEFRVGPAVAELLAEGEVAEEERDRAVGEARPRAVADRELGRRDPGQVLARGRDGGGVGVEAEEEGVGRVGVRLGQEGAAAADRVEDRVVRPRLAEEGERRRHGGRQRGGPLGHAPLAQRGVGRGDAQQAEVVRLLDAEHPEDVVLVGIVGQRDAQPLQFVPQPAPRLLAREVRAVGGDDEAEWPPLRPEDGGEALQLRLRDLVAAVEGAVVDLLRDAQDRAGRLLAGPREEEQVVVALAEDRGTGGAGEDAAKAQLGQCHARQPRRATDDPGAALAQVLVRARAVGRRSLRRIRATRRTRRPPSATRGLRPAARARHSSPRPRKERRIGVPMKPNSARIWFSR